MRYGNANISSSCKLSIVLCRCGGRDILLLITPFAMSEGVIGTKKECSEGAGASSISVMYQRVAYLGFGTIDVRIVLRRR